MSLKLKFVAFSLLGILCFSGCKNDLDTNAEWKEIFVTYCLLNPNDSVQYAKVGRAYLSYDKSALEVAQISDSLYFDSVKVELLETPGNKVITLKKDFSKNSDKDTGIFSNSANVLYSTNEKINPTRTYTLRVTNLKSGNTTEATTNIAGSVEYGYPNAQTPAFNVDTGKTYSVFFDAGNNAEIYNLKIRFWYNEYDATTNVFLDSHYVDWNVLNNIEIPVTRRYDIKLPGDDFFLIISEAIPVKANVYRKASGFDFYYWGANNQFLTYYNVNKPSIGIVQKKPDYTNFGNDSYGLFASRASNTLYRISPGTATLTRLASMPSVKALNFQ